MYRRALAGAEGERRLEVLLVHPGAWSIPKGEVEPEELGPAPATVTAAKARNRAAGVDLLAVALREVREETGLAPEGPFQPLGGVKAHHHKLYAWAAQHDCDPAAIVSNAFAIEWPPRSGTRSELPEVDRAAWFDLPAARVAIAPAQRRFIDDLEIVAGGA